MQLFRPSCRAPRSLTTAGRLFFATLALSIAGCGGGGSSLTGPTGTSISVADPTNATSITYTTDIQPILASDCTACHNSTLRAGGHDFTTYAGILSVVTPGSANSDLVRATQPGGEMYSNLRTTASEKSATIRRWVVDFRAAQ